VISLQADVDEVVARLLKRAEIEGRSDDNEDTIRVRLKEYAEKTAPLLDIYRDRGILVEIDGLGPIDEVSARLFEALDKLGSASAA
jgi:adenylate kinase